jgi:hypothetical protein
MKHLVCQLIILLKGCLVLSLEASVSPNPFLRPGSQQKPPASAVKKFIPKPIPQKDMSKEIEFRGYFILKGKPYFCLFNKKSNHAEWISLSENTYEEFQASEFNMESEVLTVIYEGSSYEISLLQGGSSIGSSKTNSIPVIPSSSNKLNSSASRTPRYMPPRPKTAPQLPDWLVNKKNSSFPSSSTSLSGTKLGSLGSVPRRVIPGLPMPSSQSRTTDSRPESNLNSGINNSRNSIVQRINRTTEPTIGLDSSENTSLDNIVDDAVTPTTESTTFDLDGLPPPPPPPNITPPSPPPNILPSREN